MARSTAARPSQPSVDRNSNGTRSAAAAQATIAIVAVSGSDACHCSAQTPMTNAISAASLIRPASAAPRMHRHPIKSTQRKLRCEALNLAHAPQVFSQGDARRRQGARGESAVDVRRYVVSPGAMASESSIGCRWRRGRIVLRIDSRSTANARRCDRLRSGASEPAVGAGDDALHESDHDRAAVSARVRDRRIHARRARFLEAAARCPSGSGRT